MTTSVIADRRNRTELASVWDYRRLARERLPQVAFDFIEGGSYDEVTLRNNRRAFDAIPFRQRVMADVSNRTRGIEIFGRRSALPLALGPTGFMGKLHPDGEILAARAAAAANIPFCLSTMSIVPIEEVAAASPAPIWFQLYLLRDRGMCRELLARAKTAGTEVLLVGMDLHVEGRRNRDLRNGLTIPARLSWKQARSVLSHPTWFFQSLKTRHKTLGTLAPLKSGDRDIDAMIEWVAQVLSPELSYRDIEWLRGEWPGRLVVKGLLDREDAEIAVKSGADGVVVSNHGGRQLDGALPAVEVLPDIAAALDGKATVLLDSGIRSGLDVLKALALGAKACLIGRPQLYGLGARGGPGVEEVIALFDEELDAAMALTGTLRCDAVDPGVVQRRHGCSRPS